MAPTAKAIRPARTSLGLPRVRRREFPIKKRQNRKSNDCGAGQAQQPHAQSIFGADVSWQKQIRVGDEQSHDCVEHHAKAEDGQRGSKFPGDRATQNHAKQERERQEIQCRPDHDQPGAFGPPPLDPKARCINNRAASGQGRGNDAMLFGNGSFSQDAGEGELQKRHTHYDGLGMPGRHPPRCQPGRKDPSRRATKDLARLRPRSRQSTESNQARN